jgi:cell division protein FtsN
LAQNEDGEFELILGNRQLVSVFLIVVILLGVFFSMGYIVGRNSSPPAVAANAGKPIVVDNSRTTAPLPEEPATAPPAAAPPAVTPPANQAPAPVVETPVPVIEKPSPAHGGAIEKKPEAPKRVEKNPPPVEVSKRAEVGQPPTGTYLQVVATNQPDAEIVAESLAKKSFHALVAPIPGSAMHRVVVGPLRDAGDVAETRTRLEAAGFKPIVRKY